MTMKQLKAQLVELGSNLGIGRERRLKMLVALFLLAFPKLRQPQPVQRPGVLGLRRQGSLIVRNGVNPVAKL